MKRISNLYDMKINEKNQYLNDIKNRGNNKYQLKKYKTALNIYNMGIKCIQTMIGNDNDSKNNENNNDNNDSKNENIEMCKQNLYLNASMLVYIYVYILDQKDGA